MSVQPSNFANLGVPITGAALMAADIPAPPSLIEGLLPAGSVALLAGAPKAGKSWLALTIALAVSNGAPFLDTFPTSAGNVLYLALEESPHLTKSRLSRLGARDRTMPSFVWRWHNEDDGGLEILDLYLSAAPMALVVVDVVRPLRGSPRGKQYEDDARFVGEVLALARKHECTFLLVDHLTKGGDIPRSNGYAGTAEVLMVLKGSEQKRMLTFTGRDVPLDDFRLRFDGGLFTLDENPDENPLSGTKLLVMSAFGDSGPLGPKEVALRSGVNEQTTKWALNSLVDEERLVKLDRGKYAPPSVDVDPAPVHIPVTPISDPPQRVLVVSSEPTPNIDVSGGTEIEWAHYTFNPWHGCVRVSEACRFCYAEADAKRQLHNEGEIWGKGSPRWFPSADYWKQPAAWQRKAIKDGVRYRVFCASEGDVFERHDDEGWNAKLDTERERLWDTIVATPNLDWLLLTKRPENVLAMVPERWLVQWPGNVWVGTSTENQKRADDRLPILATIPAPVRFISAEPLLGPLDLTPYLGWLDWVISGGEYTKRKADTRRTMPEWFTSLRDQCVGAKVPFLFKQWGCVGADGVWRLKKLNGRELEGRLWDQYPTPRAAGQENAI